MTEVSTQISSSQGIEATHVEPIEGDKHTKALKRLGVVIWLVILSLIAIDLALISQTRTIPYEEWGFRGFQAYLAIPIGTLGVVIVRRYPRNWIAWLFLGSSVIGLLQEISGEYAFLSLLLEPERYPGGEWGSWLNSWLWIPGTIAFIFHVLLLFPNGRLLSPLWRSVAWFGSIISILLMAFIAFAPGPVPGPGQPLNPIRSASMMPWSEDVLLVPIVLVMLSSFIAVLSLFIRYHQSTQQVRQQLKWFLFAAVFAPFAVGAGQFEGLAADILLVAVTLPAPIVITFAILRYRLYDIDIIIRKTLLYGLLTGLLVAMYFVGVVIFQQLFRSFSGQSSSFAIVLTTLAIAALFNPLRQRLQTLIDSRFYRKKYDAQLALDSFITTARDDVDLDQLSAELVRVANDAMNPQHISIWLRPQSSPFRRESGDLPTSLQPSSRLEG